MGYLTTKRKPYEKGRKKRERISEKERLVALSQRIERHMNFEYPELRGNTPEEVARFVVETIARFISPPKIEQEDENFTCEDLAGAIRALEPEILSRIPF